MSNKNHPIDIIVDEYNRRKMQDIDLALRLSAAGLTVKDCYKISYIPEHYMNDIINLLSTIEKGHGSFEVHTNIAKQQTISGYLKKNIKKEYNNLKDVKDDLTIEHSPT